MCMSFLTRISLDVHAYNHVDMLKPMIIAIDGPAASGKGTIAKQVAAIYGLPHLDTGLIYRAVAKAVLDGGYAPDNVEKAIDAAIALDPTQFDESVLKAIAAGAKGYVDEAAAPAEFALGARPPGRRIERRPVASRIGRRCAGKPGAVVSRKSDRQPELHSRS